MIRQRRCIMYPLFFPKLLNIHNNFLYELKLITRILFLLLKQILMLYVIPRKFLPLFPALLNHTAIFHEHFHQDQ
jgi:hypothetical protein